MENTQLLFKTNIIKDKLLLHDAVEMEKIEAQEEYTCYKKYHNDNAFCYQNIESYLDETVVGHDATIDEFVDYIYNNPLTFEQVETIISLQNNPLFKKAVGMAALKNIEELSDYIFDYYEEYNKDGYIDISNRGQKFNYNGKKVYAVKTAEELGEEVESIAEKINSLKTRDIITAEKSQEFQKLLFDIYEYYLSIANGEQLDFPKISDSEYRRLKEDAFIHNITMERQLVNLIRKNKKEFQEIQDLQHNYYEKTKQK